LLIRSAQSLATLTFGFPMKPSAPVRSVAMPTLIGSAAQVGDAGMIQLPARAETAPAVQAALLRKFGD
jgi:hypothetical protein